MNHNHSLRLFYTHWSIGIQEECRSKNCVQVRFLIMNSIRSETQEEGYFWARTFWDQNVLVLKVYLFGDFELFSLILQFRRQSHQFIQFVTLNSIQFKNLELIQISVMFSKQTLNNSFTNNPFRRPTSNYIPHRSQTPTQNFSPNAAYNRQGGGNRSFTKVGGYERQSQQPFYQKQQLRSSNISKSRVSVQSSNSQLSFLNSDEGNIFPEDLIFLLKNEQKNINNFKEKIQKEKNKVENDFAVFKTQIQHILEDVKISLQAQLDLVYKTFITKYAELKGQVNQIRQLRKQILINNISSNKYFNNLNTTSNKDLVGEIEKDVEQFKNFKVYGYITELQKQKLTPVLGLTNDLILIGSADCPFYRNKEMNNKLKDLRANFADLLTDIYKKIHDFITTPETIIQRQRQQQENANMILRQMNENTLIQQQNMFDQPFPNNYSNVSIANRGVLGQKADQFSQAQQQRFREQGPDNMQKTRLEFVSGNQQCSVIKYGDSINFNHRQRIVTDHQDSILCIFFINQKYIATGSKDKTINIYSLDGSKITTLRGHTASICCLSMIRTLTNEKFLASGSDHGCSSLILWNTSNWNMLTKVACHTAAVTAILDLQDGRHLVTGSYDKKINLFSHAKGKIITSLSNNKTSVTSMVMTSDKSRLVSSGLDNSLSIWSIMRKNQVVDAIVPQIVIPNDSLICQLQPCLLKAQNVFAATRNGQLKVFNVRTGEVGRTLVVNSNSIIELVTIQREMKPQGPLILSCSSKDNSLVLTKMDTGVSSLLKLKYNTGIQFGCGIGPKVVFNEGRGGTVAILNQSNTSREFSLYDIDFK